MFPSLAPVLAEITSIFSKSQAVKVYLHFGALVLFEFSSRYTGMDTFSITDRTGFRADVQSQLGEYKSKIKGLNR